MSEARNFDSSELMPMDRVDLIDLELIELVAASDEVREPNLDRYHLAAKYAPDKIVIDSTRREEDG